MIKKSYVLKARNAVIKQKNKEAAQHLNEGLEYYTKAIMDVFNPYAAEDAGMIIMVLRTLANKMEENNPGSEALAKWFEEHTKTPELKEHHFAMKKEEETWDI